MAGIKTISFAVVHFSVAFSVVYLITGSVTMGGLVALVEPLVNTVAFYLHERLWMWWGAIRRGVQSGKTALDTTEDQSSLAAA